MAFLNLMFDLAGLALWLNWLTIPLDPLAKTAPASLAGTLKRTDAAGSKRWKFAAALAALLLARAWLWLQLSAIASVTPKLRLGFISIPFRADLAGHMIVFSTLSFGVILGAFYLWMLFLSAVNHGLTDANPFHKLVGFQVKWLERWPAPMKLLSPFLLGSLAWLALHPLLERLAVVPGNKSAAQLLEQAAVIGAGTFLAWKYLILGVLLIHLVNTHVYLGDLPIWNYVDATARNLLSPLRRLPLRVGRVDFLPLVVMALVVLLAYFVGHPPHGIYRLLPF
jgi:uncharacterized protein YggT (Ycf19 family)